MRGFGMIAAPLLAIALFAGCSSSDDGSTDGGTDAQVDAQLDAVAPADLAADTPIDGGPDAEPPELVVECPGREGCASNEGELLAGAAAVDISPVAYEAARWSYLREQSYCPPPTPVSPHGLNRCGPLVNKAQTARADCGLDGLCPGDNLKTRVACDADHPCPDPAMTCNQTEQRCYLAYSGPDADGSEGDGVPDWFLDCGRDRVCPCLDPAGAPAYYGAGGKCLTGHTANPVYQGPDADGSEGNGTFEGLWMAGFGADHPLNDRHDSIWARALVLRTGETTVAIV